MAVWLTHGPRTVGLEDGVLRAADFATLATAAVVASTIDAERERVLAAARAEAEAALAEAKARAQALIEEAQQQLDEGWQRGYDQGLEDAAAQWAAQAMDASEARRRGLARQSERLSALVSMAVERIIENEDRAALFKRSLRTITRLIKDVPMLTLRVPEADRDSAQGAVDAVMSQLSAALPIEIVADAAIPEGGCRFESDRGVIDAGLDTQLAAIRRAVSRAAHQMARESEAAGDDEAADEPEDELTTATSIDDALEVSRFEADAGDDFVAIDLPAAAAVEAAEELVTDAAEVEEGLTVLDAGDDFVAIDIPAAAAVEAVEDIAEVEETFTVLDAEEDDDEPDDDEQDDEPVHTIVARYVTDDDEPVAEDALAEA